MADEDFVKTLNVYYCTEFGKVKGQFQISQSRIFFEPSSNDNKSLGQLRRFEVCIDMGDVISVKKKTLINESGKYQEDLEARKSYMYDFFLQIDLASVNRKKNFTEVPADDDEEEKLVIEEHDEMDGGRMAPSFINTHLGATFQGNDPQGGAVQNEENVKAFLKSQALDELSKARPVATVFFRFSHKDSKTNKFLKVEE